MHGLDGVFTEEIMGMFNYTHIRAPEGGTQLDVAINNNI